MKKNVQNCDSYLSYEWFENIGWLVFMAYQPNPFLYK